MAAVLEIDESNGATETITHGVASLAMGTVDAAGMTPGTPGARQAPSTHGIQKALRFHVTSFGGSSGVTGLRVYCDPAATGWALYTNGDTNSAGYAASKITAFVQPNTDITRVPNVLPLADPGVPNLGVAGSLTGTITSPGGPSTYYSDYLYLQLRSGPSVVAGFTAPCYFAYDELG